MVLIHTRQTDDTTVEIIQWLKAIGKQTFRINKTEDLLKAKECLDNDEVSALYFNGSGMLYSQLQVEDETVRTKIFQFLEQDIEAIWVNLFSNRLDKIKTFGVLPYPGNFLNKLNVLDKANEIGLTIPVYELIYTKKRLIDFQKSHGRIICKSTVDGISIFTQNVILHGQRTEEILSDEIEGFSDVFFPTFVQQLIEKAFELRVFYYNGLIYSIALFTQSNEKSKIDSRSIDTQKPQRKVPFLLPKEIETKVTALMMLLNLNYGSIDFMITAQNEFYFLEVNPYGQFGFLSKAGNFYIEKEIAELL